MATKVKPSRLQVSGTPQVGQVPVYVDEDTFQRGAGGGGGASFGRFLSLWDSTTGLPISFPEAIPYTYITGDYFIVEVVSSATPPVNYKPDGSTYSGTASSVTESDEVEVGDTYVYDGQVWLLQSNHGKTVTFANIAGDPYDNTNLSNALSAKANDSAVVKLTGNQTIAGTKTFSTSPVVPSKTTAATNTGTAIATEAQVYAKQDKLTTQTAYTTKGTSTKVPTITTNTLGQVTAITETSIAFPVTSVNGSTGAVVLDADDISDSTTTNKFVTQNDKDTWDAKQDELVSEVNIRTINGTSILGSGDITTPVGPTYTAGTGIDITSNAISTTNNFGTSSTAAATVQKEVSIPGIKTLNVGQVVHILPSTTSTVAASTLKVNNFTAYPMRYNNAAITTSTDSVVRPANIVTTFVFDGTYRQFMGHGLDSNTTYSNMSASEANTGTATSARTISASVLKGAVKTHAPVQSVNGQTGAVVFNEGAGIRIGNDYSAMQGPAPTGFHVPLNTEWQAVYDIWTALGGGSSDGTNFGIALKLPFAGYRGNLSSGVYSQGSYGLYWSSSRYDTDSAYDLYFTSSALDPQNASYRAYGFSVRYFKDTPTIPTSSWTKLYGTSIEAGGIFWSSTDGLISLSSDGTNWITIADKNLGATTVWNSGDTLSEANSGKYYQWGNNYSFPFTGSVTTSSTQVDASNYGPGNYYSSSTFITRSSSPYRWDTTDNGNLWGGVTGIISNAIINTAMGTGVGGDVLVSDQANNILTSGTKLWAGTQANYEALGTYDNNTVYLTI